MEHALPFALGSVVLLLGSAGMAWLFWRCLKKSDDPARLLFRCLLTLVVIAGGYFSIDWVIGPAGGLIEKMCGVFLGMFLGLILAGLWVPPLVEKISELIGSLFTGGSEPPPRQPFYSIAEAKRKQGKF